jgi:O-antigen/teichoic acid export membrane protein
MTLRGQAIQGLKWQAIELVGRQLLSLAVFTALARLLEPAAFGLMGLIAVYLAFVGMLAEQGLGTALIQRHQLEPEHIDTVFWTNLALSAAICGVTIALARPIANAFGEPSLASLLRWGSFALIINSLAAVQGRLFVREMNFREPALRLLLGNLAGGAIGVTMALSGMGVWALVGQQLGTAVVGSMFICIASSYRPTLRFSMHHLRDVWRVGGAVFVTSALSLLAGRTDQLIIGRFLGATSLGYYAIANRLADLAKTALYQPLGAVALPALSRMQHDRSRLHLGISAAMDVTSIVSFPALIGLSAISMTAVPVLLGGRWQSSARVLQLLSFCVLLHGIWCIIHYALLATGRAGTVAVLNSMQMLGVVAACMIGMSSGLHGIVIGLLICEASMTIVRLCSLQRCIGYSPIRYLRPCLEPAVAAALMYAVILWCERVMSPGEPRWRLPIAQVAAGAATYLVSMSFLARSRLRRLWQLVLPSYRGCYPVELVREPAITAP